MWVVEGSIPSPVHMFRAKEETKPEPEKGACAHLHVSWRTEQIGSLTRGWWECDSGCGTKFFPLKRRTDYER